MPTNEFLVSVANAIVRNSSTGEAMYYGKADITSAFTLSMTATDVRAGINNPLLYSYYHDRNVEVKIEEAIFNTTILGLNVGQLVSSGAVNVTQTDCIVLASGSGTLTCTPVGNVDVLLPNGNWVNVTPTGTTIYVAAGGNQRIDAVYITSKTADRITVETTTPPTVVDLTLIAEIRDNTGTLIKYLQINVPRFQVSGNYTLSLAANGVSNQALDGKALAVASTDCATGEYYAKVTWVPVTFTASYSWIVALPNPSNFASGATVRTQQLTVSGYRGGIYGTTNITTSASFAMLANGNSGSPYFSVSSGGLITAGSSGSQVGHGAQVKATYYDATSGSLFDYVNCYVV